MKHLYIAVLVWADNYRILEKNREFMFGCTITLLYYVSVHHRKERLQFKMFI